MQIQPPAAEVVIMIAESGRKPRPLRLTSREECRELIRATALATAMLPDDGQEAAAPSSPSPHSGHSKTLPSAANMPGSQIGREYLDRLSRRELERALLFIAGYCSEAFTVSMTFLERHAVTGAPIVDDEPERGEHPYPEPCRVTRTNGAGTTEFCTRDAGHDGPHRDGPCAEWTTAIIVENGDAPADLVADTTAEMDHCQAYAENPRGIDQLLCWRPGGHDGPHYDKVDQLAWTISGADEPEPDDTVSDRVVVEAETGTMLAGPMTPGTAMQWVNLKRAAWGVPMKIEHLTREPVHSRQCGDFHQEYSGCTRTADHAAVHAHITSDGTVAGIWPRPAATVNPAVAGTPVPGRDGYVTGTCGHPMASQEWESGWSLCEQCDPGERLVTAPATPEASRM